MGYLTFAIRTVTKTLVSVLIASLLLFGSLSVIPGRASSAALGTEATDEARAAFDERMGLNQPLHLQYVTWISGAISGDFGQSIQNRQEISTELARRLPATLQLAVLAMAVAVVIAVPAAAIAAYNRGRLGDVASTLIALIGLSVPGFIIATILILVVSLQLQWLPSGGYVPFTEDPVRSLQLMILPAIALGLPSAAMLMRVLRSSLIDARTSDYVRSARARGAGEFRVLFSHMARNVFVAVMTVAAIELSVMFGGAIIIEEIFGIPGIGSYVLQGIRARDFRVLQAAALTVTVFVILANAVVDLIAATIDPRSVRRRVA